MNTLRNTFPLMLSNVHHDPIFGGSDASATDANHVPLWEGENAVDHINNWALFDF